jgi:hypothetical protein
MYSFLGDTYMLTTLRHITSEQFGLLTSKGGQVEPQPRLCHPAKPILARCRGASELDMVCLRFIIE